MATYHVVPLQLSAKTLRKQQWETLREQNPKRWRRTPVVTIAHLTSEATVKRYLDGDFSSSKSSWNKKGESVLTDHMRSFESKIEAYRYAEDLVEELRDLHWRVFYDDPCNRRVYIIRLKDDVWKDKGTFAKANGGEKADWADFLYVGETSKSVEERYADHLEEVDGKKGPLAAKYVFEHHQEIAYDLMEGLESKFYRKAGALERERELALELRSQGYATWFN
jgi:hypothetical protein